VVADYEQACSVTEVPDLAYPVIGLRGDGVGNGAPSAVIVGAFHCHMVELTAIRSGVSGSIELQVHGHDGLVRPTETGTIDPN